MSSHLLQPAILGFINDHACSFIVFLALPHSHRLYSSCCCSPPRVLQWWTIGFYQGDYMHASIWKGFVSKFQSLIEEGKVYRISRFRVVDNKKTHKVVSGDYMINFVPSTFVMDLAEQDSQFGHHVFEIVDFGTARSRLGKNIELSDVVGRFAGLSKINDQFAFGSMLKTRVLGLQDSSDHSPTAVCYIFCPQPTFAMALKLHLRHPHRWSILPASKQPPNSRQKWILWVHVASLELEV